MEPKVMSIDDYATTMHISRGYAYALAKKNQLPGLIRVGNRMVVSIAAVEKILAAAEQAAEVVHA